MNRMVALAAKKYALMPFPTPQETPPPRTGWAVFVCEKSRTGSQQEPPGRATHLRTRPSWWKRARGPSSPEPTIGDIGNFTQGAVGAFGAYSIEKGEVFEGRNQGQPWTSSARQEPGLRSFIMRTARQANSAEIFVFGSGNSAAPFHLERAAPAILISPMATKLGSERVSPHRGAKLNKRSAGFVATQGLSQK
jgi:hypothetical protein